MSAVMDPWTAHQHLRDSLGTPNAGAAFLDMVCAFDPRHEVSAKGMFRAVTEICYGDFEIFAEGLIYDKPQDGAPMESIEPFIRGALSSLQRLAALHDRPAYLRVNHGINTPKNYLRVIESAWTNLAPAPNLPA